MNQVITFGVDLAKHVFQAHGVDAQGAVVVRRQLRRREVRPFFAKLPRCVVGIEACSTSHYWAREIAAAGHDVKLIPPVYVKPYVKRQKNDQTDAAAICEAVTRPSMTFVPVKTVAAQASLCLMRVRETLVRQRTLLANCLRSHMAEFGFSANLGHARLMERLDELEPHDLPELARIALDVLRGEILSIDQRVRRLDTEIRAVHKTNEASQRLTTIPGIGIISASMIAATVPCPEQFRSGRHFAAWIGLVPRQHSSGGKERLGRISKMGNRDLRRLLVMGAVSRMRHVAKAPSRDDIWFEQLKARKSGKLAVVALANKMARIVWAVLKHGTTYNPNFLEGRA